MANTLLTGGRGRSPSWPGMRLLAGAAVVLGVASVAAWVMHRDADTFHPQGVAFADAVDARPAADEIATRDRQRGNDVSVDRMPLEQPTTRTRFEATGDLYAYVQS